MTSSSGKKQAFYILSPPPMFSYLDSNLSCCFGPLSKSNISFFKSVGFEKVLNYSGKKLDSALIEFCSTINVVVHDININDQDFPRSSIPKFTEWLTIQVLDVITQCQSQPVVLFGSLDNHISTLVSACIRRQADWSLLSIFAEFRQFTWPYKMRDYEQIIENFQPAISVPTDTKGNIDMEIAPKRVDNGEEESRIEGEVFDENMRTTEQLLSRPVIETAEVESVRQVNDVLRRLFLPSPHTKLISEESVFDPSISLVNDKDEDD